MKIVKEWLKHRLRKALAIPPIEESILEIRDAISNFENKLKFLEDKTSATVNNNTFSQLYERNIKYINLDIFRIEAKNAAQEDQRYFQFGSPESLPYIAIQPHKDYPHTIVTVNTQTQFFSEKLYYSHLALAKLVTEYEFQDVLDIGSANGTSAKVFKVLGKNVSTIEILPQYEADYSGDYLDIKFPKQFDAIWCSHVLEHQRNVGMFLDKIFSDLKEGGVLAITVPSALSPLLIGHPNIYTPLHLIYNLVLAGFDCRDAKIKCYDWQFSIIVKKKSNNIKFTSFAATHYPPTDGAKDAIGYEPNLLKFFPLEIPVEGAIWGEIDSINWD